MAGFSFARYDIGRLAAGAGLAALGGALLLHGPAALAASTLGGLLLGVALWPRRQTAASALPGELAGVLRYRWSSRQGGVYFSPGVDALLGWTADELCAQPQRWWQSIHPEHATTVLAALQGLERDAVVDLEYRLCDARGNWRWLLDHAVGCGVEDGERRVDGVVLDITARKLAELALVRREADWVLLFEQLPLGLRIRDAAGSELQRNALWQRLDEAARVAAASPLAASAEAVEDEPPPLRVLDASRMPRLAVDIACDTSEESSLRQRLEDERSLLRHILDAIPDIVFLKDAQLAYREVNQAFLDFAGRRRDEVIGFGDTQLFAADAAESRRSHDQRVINGRLPQRRGEVWHADDGRPVSFDIVKLPLFDAAGRPTGLVGVARDTTADQAMEREHRRLLEELAGTQVARARAEAAVAEDRSRQIIGAIAEAVVGLDGSGRVSFLNPAAEALFGYSEGDALGRSFHLLTHHTRADGSYYPVAECPLSGAVAGRRTAMRGTDLFWRRDGSSFVGEYSYLPLSGDHQLLVGAVLLMRDVSQRERTAERLRMLSRVVEDGPAAVAMTDPQGLILYVNQRFTETTGYREVDILGKRHNILASGQTPPETYQALWAALSAGQEWRGELRNRRRDGGLYWSRNLIMPLRSADGAVSHFLSISEDISHTRELEENETAARRAAESALRQLEVQEQRLRLITDNLPAMILHFDSEQIIRYCNLPYARFFGFDRERANGRKLREILGDAIADEIAPAIERVYQGEEVRYLARRGERSISAVWLPERSGARRVVGCYALVLDITDQQLAAQQLATARDSAESAAIAKGQFLANISHEIRTPMHAILGLTELALRGEMPAPSRSYVEKAHRAGRLLLALLDDVLDLSKIEAGRLDLESHPFRLSEVIERTTDLFAESAADKGLRFVIDLAPELPVSLVGDALRLTQVIGNLCSNAIKFTEQGEVALRLTTADDDDATVRLCVSVSDSGIGMTAEQAERVFDAFAQADGTTTRRYGGTGLGLAICRNLVELMGGRLSLETRLGEGSRFSFELRLPRAADTAPPQAAVIAAAATPSLRGKRVLVAEDYALNVEIVCEFLHQAGCLVSVSHNGQDALHRLETQTFDAVLMDCQMPVMDGYEATRAIRRRAAWRQLPVIAMTANAMAGDRDKCLAAGMNDYLAKPVSQAELLAALARNLGVAAEAALASASPQSLQTSAAPAAADVATAAPDFSHLPGIDVELGLQSAMGKTEFYARVLRIFIDTQQDFSACFDALRGDPADPGAACRAAHTLKGAAANIGASALHDAALRLEQACKRQASAAELDAANNAVAAELAPVISGLRHALGM